MTLHPVRISIDHTAVSVSLLKMCQNTICILLQQEASVSKETALCVSLDLRAIPDALLYVGKVHKFNFNEKIYFMGEVNVYI